MIDLYPILAVHSFLTGASIASFLNVVIWRVPRGESIVSPPSHCPKCGNAVRWWQNIPILSYLALRGRCAHCRTTIPPRYIIVETIGGILFLAAFLHFFSPGGNMSDPAVWMTLIVWWAWISLMIVGSFIDFDHKLLPDFSTVGGMILGLGHALVLSVGNCLSSGFCALQPYLPLINSTAGLAFGFGLLWLVRLLGSKAFGREAMGMGDVFLMGAVGALFGPVAVLVTLILSSVFGSIVGLSLIALSKARLGRFVEIPYGPYICLGCLAWMFFGPWLVSAYLSLFRL